MDPPFLMKDFRDIYEFPLLRPGKRVAAIVTPGGGLAGTVSEDGVLTDGDVQRYWAASGIPEDQFPTVVIVPVGNARHTPVTDVAVDQEMWIATKSNTVDVQALGSCYPSSDLTILLFLASYNNEGIFSAFRAALNPVYVGDQIFKSDVIVCAWVVNETPLMQNAAALVRQGDLLLQYAAMNGVNVCAAVGYTDTGSHVANFPASSQYAVSCGTTNLICPSRRYDSNTVETAPTTGYGGGASIFFAKPSFQDGIVSGSQRATPDVSFCGNNISFVLGGADYVADMNLSASIMAAFLLSWSPGVFALPSIYTAPNDCFHDVTDTLGWDFLTGRGSVRCQVLARNVPVSPLALVPVESVSVSPPVATLAPGQRLPLSPTLRPANSSEKSLEWSTSNAAVATVGIAGIVTAVAGGVAKITARSNNGKTGSADVVVEGAQVHVSGVSLAVGLRRRQVVSLLATVTPPQATNAELVWSSSAPSVAAVDQNGYVTAHSSGSATISATADDNGLVASVLVVVPT